MRKTWVSSKMLSTRRLSSRASCSVVPNGFSMISAHLAVLVVGEL